MNVLQINTVYRNGSTGQITAEIAEYTAIQPGANAVVAFGIGEPVQREHLTAVRIGNPMERKFHGAIRRYFDAEGYGSRFATRQLIRLCEEQHINVVHLHNLHGCYLNLRLWFRYLQKAKIPVIWTLHDCWSLTGHCAHFTYAGCEKWKTECGACPQQRSYPVCVGLDGSKRNYRLKQKLFAALPNLTLVLPCRWLEGIVKDSFLQDVPTRVIYNGVDTRRFRPIASDIRLEYALENKHVLLAAASIWTDRKGLPELIRLGKTLDGSYRIVILGLTDEQSKALPETITDIGRIDNLNELRAWYSTADCFVNPTLEDTMPLVNLESLACGTPVVTFDTGGCPEAIDESCGIVVEQGNVPALADAVKQICESGTDYTPACMARAAQFDVENTLQAYFDLYREVNR